MVRTVLPAIFSTSCRCQPSPLASAHAQVRAGRARGLLPLCRGEKTVLSPAALIVHAKREERMHLRRAHVADLAADDRAVRRRQRGQLQRGQAA